MFDFALVNPGVSLQIVKAGNLASASSSVSHLSDQKQLISVLGTVKSVLTTVETVLNKVKTVLGTVKSVFTKVKPFLLR